MNHTKTCILQACLLLLFCPLRSLSFTIYEASVTDVLHALKTNQTTCEEVVSLTLDRIKRFDRSLNSLVLVFDKEALEQARELDKRQASQFGPLHCIPFILKDNIDIPPFPTSAGVGALASSIPSRPAPIAKALLDAGAILVGKSNMPDFAFDGMNTNSSVTGQTFNPYDLRRSPYGSSGGSAVAAAVSFGVFSIGTDTDGSIQNPAAAANVVGLRPTSFRLNTSGIVPLISFQDTAGPFARSVSDAQIIYSVLCVAMPSTCSNNQKESQPGPFKVGFLNFVTESITAPFISIPDPNVVEAFTFAQRAFAQNPLLSPVSITNATILQQFYSLLGDATPSSDLCQLQDFKSTLNNYLSTLSPSSPFFSRKLVDIINSGNFFPWTRISSFATAAEESGPDLLPDQNPDCSTYASYRALVAEMLENAMDEMGLVALAYPTGNQPPPSLDQITPIGMWLPNAISAFSGLPALVIPMGFVPTPSPIPSVFSLPCCDYPVTTSAEILEPHQNSNCQGKETRVVFDALINAYHRVGAVTGGPWLQGNIDVPIRRVCDDRSYETVPTRVSHEKNGKNGKDLGVPVGLTLLGRRGSEMELFKLAKEMEEVLDVISPNGKIRVPPPLFPQ